MKSRVKQVGYAAAFLLVTPPSLPAAIWTNPGVGDWNLGSNWDLGTPPTALDLAVVNNGGVAQLNLGSAAPATVVTRLEIGRDGSAGEFVGAGASFSIASDFDIGEIADLLVDAPPSNGRATLSNAASLTVGTSGLGDLDVGPASALAGTSASAHGQLDLVAVGQISIQEDLEIGQAAGPGDAQGDGVVAISQANQIHVGRQVEIGTASMAGAGNAQGAGSLSIVGA
ncbi:MAG: hypothetical protein KDA61_16120 [Planctomycetales bacterium]|nr:hypothetical protein [Planctomycetales bacterium]